MGTWGNQCTTTLLVCVAHSIPRGNIFLLFYSYLNVNKLISFQSFAVDSVVVLCTVYPYDNITNRPHHSSPGAATPRTPSVLVYSSTSAVTAVATLVVELVRYTEVRSTVE